MPYRIKRGMGAIPDNPCDTRWAWAIPKCWSWWNPSTKIGVPPAPEGDALILPPASGEDAAALQQQLADEALRRQQEVNAANVQSSWLDQFASGVTGDASNISWLAWIAGGLLVAGVVMGGGRRR